MYICRNELDHIFEEKDLSVTIYFELKLEQHITQKTRTTFHSKNSNNISLKKLEQHFTQKMNTANTIMGVIRRSFSFLYSKLFKKLYTTFVRPHLEYAQAVCAPYLAKHVNMVCRESSNAGY